MKRSRDQYYDAPVYNMDFAGKPGGKKHLYCILEKAGLWLGRDGLVDAYEKSASTVIANKSLSAIRPDIVHQCLLALCDTDLYFNGRLRIYISTVHGKTIQLAPQMRPPRTYGRFKGLMESLLRDGEVVSSDGQILMKIMPGTVAPIIPNGASVIGLCNLSHAPVISPIGLGKTMVSKPIDEALQGGKKDAMSFVVIPCTDDVDLSGIDYITRTYCLSQYPTTSHVLAARICEGVGHALFEDPKQHFNKHLRGSDDASHPSGKEADSVV
eukprot:Tbor_TRINITY_DN2844_c0_g1::TRINITY_DN2844_c0_g1_i1::g.23201::m.23201/K14568/EMG1, NEP1; rRNA small subunit pseudouridine methyltransferase Nep1